MSEEFQIIGTDNDLEKIHKYEEESKKYEEESKKYQEECEKSDAYKKKIELLTKNVSDLKLQLNQMRIEKEELRDYFDTTIDDLKNQMTIQNDRNNILPPKPPNLDKMPPKPMKLFKSPKKTPIFKKKKQSITTQPMPPLINVISRNDNTKQPDNFNESIYNTAKNIYRKTADICKCSDCLNHHRYADGYCHIHRYMRLNLV